MDAAKVVSVEDCGPDGFRWLTLKKITWQDPAGRQRLWESAERTTRRGEVDGVAIIAKVVGANRAPMLPVLKQFRPPVANYCLELPAGLVDAGESVGQAAVRELLEETGYTGRVVEETAICVSDPGMSNANMRYVTLEVDADAPENQNVVQQLEDGEFIQVELVPWAGLLQHLQVEMAATGCAVDARLLSYACGLEHAQHASGGLEQPLQQAGPPAARVDGSSSCTLDSNASWGPLPFGSPIVSPLSSSALPAAATLTCSTQQQQRRWPAFAAGVAAGAAGCWLVLVGRVR
ncbi:hypothetical protein D9Q98_003758 [Chlorella vulgaris]|uniref:Nudix hydrolase domain-containing protein n=1 Tax=Chlorella vulgaris TaxID=3077 RepID=A0A9D4TTB5_CHLVU|nr:hypothetical protein D9Q98_003758 [Chlorella vulgaris]